MIHDPPANVRFRNQEVSEPADDVVLGEALVERRHRLGLLRRQLDALGRRQAEKLSDDAAIDTHAGQGHHLQGVSAGPQQAVEGVHPGRLQAPFDTGDGRLGHPGDAG